MGAGVYIVYRNSDEPPSFLERSPAGRYQGKDPTVPTAVLESAWVFGARVLNIGKAALGSSGRRGLAKRLGVAPDLRTATSSMLSPPASIDPITVNGFVPLLAPCLDNLSRWSTKPAKSIRCARTAAGNSPAFRHQIALIEGRGDPA